MSGLEVLLTLQLSQLELDSYLVIILMRAFLPKDLAKKSTLKNSSLIARFCSRDQKKVKTWIY